MEPQLEKLAMNLFNIGAVKFGAFSLKQHEDEPDAPLSPVYINLRTLKHPEHPGPLTRDILADIGNAFADVLRKRKAKYAAICGIPHAGEPLAECLGDLEGAGLPGKRAYVYLEKATDGEGKRRITRALTRSPHYAHTLLIDDVLTKAESKVEAMNALTEAGWITTRILVIVDRCQGGISKLSRRGVQVHSLFTLPQLVDFYLAANMISTATNWSVKKYLAAGN